MPILLSWDAYPSATVYGVYRTVDLSVAYTLIASPTTTSYTDTSAVLTSQYYYYVIAYDVSGNALTGSNTLHIGASENRVGKICTKVKRVLEQKGQRKISDPELISEMAQIQLELCRKYLALKTEFALTMIAGQMQYPALPGIFKIKQFIVPVSWVKGNRETGLDIITDAKIWARELNAKNFYDQSHPHKAFIWNGILRLAPAPTINGDILVVWAYGLPTLQLVYMGDPEIGIEWDDCLKDELLYRFSGDREAHARYLQNATAISGQNFKEAVEGVILIDHSSRSLGF